MFKVLHAPLDIAGQTGLICEYLIRNGLQAAAYNYFPSYLDYRNRAIETDMYQLYKIFEAATEYYDLFHFHNSKTFFTDYRDLPILKDKGKRIVMHHRGNDVRFSTKARKGRAYNNPFVYTGNSLPDAMIHRNLVYYSKFVDLVIVQDAELYQYVRDYYKKVHILPRFIDCQEVPIRYPSSKKGIPTIVHAPTDRNFKGTAAILKTIEDLKKKNPLRFILIENMPHREALSTMLQADIVIDQVLCGAYGNVSVEAMAMGKPVVAYIRDDMLNYYSADMPIQSANPDTLKEVLQKLIQYPELRRKLGMQGRLYAERVHDAGKLARTLIAWYESVMKA